jgi:hypothetical protein
MRQKRITAALLSRSGKGGRDGYDLSDSAEMIRQILSAAPLSLPFSADMVAH